MYRGLGFVWDLSQTCQKCGKEFDFTDRKPYKYSKCGHVVCLIDAFDNKCPICGVESARKINIDSFQTYFDVMNTNPQTPESELRRKFRQASLKYHPDRSVGDFNKAENNKEKMQQLVAAFEILREGYESKFLPYEQTPKFTFTPPSPVPSTSYQSNTSDTSFSFMPPPPVFAWSKSPSSYSFSKNQEEKDSALRARRSQPYSFATSQQEKRRKENVEYQKQKRSVRSDIIRNYNQNVDHLKKMYKILLNDLEWRPFFDPNNVKPWLKTIADKYPDNLTIEKIADLIPFNPSNFDNFLSNFNFQEIAILIAFFDVYILAPYYVFNLFRKSPQIFYNYDNDFLNVFLPLFNNKNDLTTLNSPFIFEKSIDTLNTSVLKKLLYDLKYSTTKKQVIDNLTRFAIEAHKFNLFDYTIFDTHEKLTTSLILLNDFIEKKF